MKRITSDKKERAEFFLKNKTLVHIKTKTEFYNGYIKEVYEDKLILEDRLFGDLPIFFNSIYRIEPFKTKEARP